MGQLFLYSNQIFGKFEKYKFYLYYREIVSTTLHEFIHVLSMPHCSYWDCIGNFSY